MCNAIQFIHFEGEILKSIALLMTTIAVVLIGGEAQAAYLSVYSSLEERDCVVADAASLHEDPEIDFLVSECPGFGGYQLRVSGSDLRYPLSLIYNTKEIELTRIHSFHSATSPKVEWLFERIKEEPLVRYKALIHRVHLEQDQNKNGEVLIVTKLNKEDSCPVAVVKASKTMNEEARAIAESVDGRPCLDLDQVSYNEF